MKPKWQFLLEEVEIKAGIGLLLGMVAVGLSVIVLFLEVYNPIDLSQFGEVGWQLIREDFPYVWLIVALVLGILGVLIERKDGQNYKITKRRLALISAGAVLMLAVIIVLVRNLFQF